ncbi:hypothetical protein P7C73_g2707, partial [Tremellales sp. Uapishka_1]
MQGQGGLYASRLASSFPPSTSPSSTHTLLSSHTPLSTITNTTLDDLTTTSTIMYNNNDYTPYPHPLGTAIYASNSPPPAFVPSLQVIQPTPTKAKGKKRAEGIAQGDDGSPSKSTLDVNVVPSWGTEMDGDSDIEREAIAREEKLARQREKGRVRQARKRAKDKADKEKREHEKREPSTTASHPLTTTMGMHLVIPSGPSTRYDHPPPSSTSSSYSQLPISSNNLLPSPSQSFSTSAASSPGLFSPLASTPGIGYEWNSLPSMSMPMSMPVDEPQPRLLRIRNRASSNSLGNTLVSRHDLTVKIPPNPPRRQGGPSPAKRRKSELTSSGSLPSITTDHDIGLGVNIGPPETMEMSWTAPTKSSYSRPRSRRTASAPNVSEMLDFDCESSRSPTPPPVPTLPAEYQRPVSSFQPAKSAWNQYVEPHRKAYETTLFSAILHRDLAVVREMGLNDDDVAGIFESLDACFNKSQMYANIGKVSLGNDGHLSQVSGPMSPPQTSPRRSVAPPHSQILATPITTSRPHTQGSFTSAVSSIHMFPTTSQQYQTPSQHLSRSRSFSTSAAAMLSRGMAYPPQTPTSDPYQAGALQTPLTLSAQGGWMLAESPSRPAQKTLSGHMPPPPPLAQNNEYQQIFGPTRQGFATPTHHRATKSRSDANMTPAFTAFRPHNGQLQKAFNPNATQMQNDDVHQSQPPHHDVSAQQTPTLSSSDTFHFGVSDAYQNNQINGMATHPSGPPHQSA